MSERALSFAKSDDDVGLLARDARAASSETCREVTIGHPKIRSVPVQPFLRPREIVHMCLRSWRLVRGRRRQAS
jgi:hypothetical protein